MSIDSKNNKGRSNKLLRALPLFIPVIVQIVAISMSKPAADAEHQTFLLLISYFLLALSTAVIFFDLGKLRVLSGIIFALSPAACCLLLESMIRNPFEVKFKILLLNFAIFYLVALFLLFLTGRSWPATLFLGVYGFAAGLTEHYVLVFRNAPLFPWDLKSVGTAVTVVDNYDFSITYGISVAVVTLMLIVILGFKLNFKLNIRPLGIIPKLKKHTVLITRSVACLLLASMMGGYVYYVNLDRSYTDFGMYPYLFTPKVVYSRNGFTVAFLSMLRYITVDKPDGYNDESLEFLATLSDTYARVQNESVDKDAQKPNIIVIMNEAFSDLSVLTDFETNEEVTPFLDSLTENTVKGNLHVSVLGGNTANTEFEFLTGCSMAYLPAGSIPYQQYIKGDIPSLASQLKSQGYSTMAIHPYNSTGWNRNTVYPWMSFDKSIFRSALKGATVFRDYVTDISVYRYIIEQFKTKSEDPLFVFNVTMQNHGSYTKVYENFNHTQITATGLESDVKLSTYLSLMKETDDAFAYLVRYFESYREPTIILMFGDHQPAATVSSKLLKRYGVTLDDTDINDVEQRYIVPFYLWANYDIEEKEYEAVSANYLATILVEVAGLEMTAAQAYLSELYKAYPVITANAVMDNKGYLYSIDAMRDEININQYAQIQYSYLFDGDEMGLFSYKDWQLETID